jgi:hypothetical protein
MKPKIIHNKILNIFILLICVITITLFQSCKDNKNFTPPEIKLFFVDGITNDGDTVEIGKPLRFSVKVKGIDENITNFTVKKVFGNTTKTVLDSGLHSTGFHKTFTFYQGVEDVVRWTFSVMDKNRMEASASLLIYKDPNSQFGGIYEFSNVRMGYQDNTIFGQFYIPYLNKVLFSDSAKLTQHNIDIVTYFYYSEQNGILKPSPTFSSPGEDMNCVGELYTLHYPFVCNWETKNYTKYDIRAVNGVTVDLFNQCHNDSLLIVSYDDVWGKKKYKWSKDGTIIPFQNAAGKKGLIHVHQADTIASGSILFSIKIQM